MGSRELLQRALAKLHRFQSKGYNDLHLPADPIVTLYAKVVFQHYLAEDN